MLKDEVRIGLFHSRLVESCRRPTLQSYDTARIPSISHYIILSTSHSADYSGLSCAVNYMMVELGLKAAGKICLIIASEATDSECSASSSEDYTQLRMFFSNSTPSSARINNNSLLRMSDPARLLVLPKDCCHSRGQVISRRDIRTAAGTPQPLSYRATAKCT